jgi:hypothetical protein
MKTNANENKSKHALLILLSITLSFLEYQQIFHLKPFSRTLPFQNTASITLGTPTASSVHGYWLFSALLYTTKIDLRQALFQSISGDISQALPLIFFFH